MSAKPSKSIVKARRYGLAAVGVVAAAGGVAGNLGSIMDLFDKFFGGTQAKVTAEAPPSVSVAGTWKAEVRYDWGDKYTEQFDLKLDGSRVSGTATFLGVRRAVLEGKMSGEKLFFVTKTRQTLNNGEEREQRHEYRGAASDREIGFEMQTTGGFTEHLPVEFKALRP